MSNLIGITTTIPQEVLLAAGFQPVDLNNIFVSDPDPERLINIAERAGFPQNCCAWIKGIYGVIMERGIGTVLCVTTGDCSNTLMLSEVLKLRGLRVIPFAFPERPEPSLMKQRLDELCAALGTTLNKAEEWRQKLAESRRLALELDNLTWQQNVVSGRDNHYWLVSSSDFNRDYGRYEQDLGRLISKVRQHQPYRGDMLRIAYIGVPPVYASDFYSFLERSGAQVVFNEIQRQFAAPDPGSSLAEQYSNYTYPYSIFDRLADINKELERRRVNGVIHYVQAFCHRGIGDIIFRQRIAHPMLTIEGNADFLLTQHLRTRIEAFLDMLRRSQRLLSHIN